VTRVFLVRHGQTDWNATRRLQGSTDIPLNDVGRAQASAMAHVLAPQLSGHATVVTSPLSRAHETATMLAAAMDAELTADPRLAERSFGEWEGTTVEEREASHPEDVAKWHAGEEPGIAGYEPHAVLAARVSAALHEHAAHDRDDLVIVSHGSALRMALTAVLGLEQAVPHAERTVEALGNAHWSELAHTPPAQWTLVAHNVGP
jgi:probable phosphoglycerate mutase